MSSSIIKLHPFLRTICECDVCKSNCRRQPGPLDPGDIARLAEFLEITEQQLIDEHLDASNGAKVGNAVTGKTLQVRTLVPKRGEDGACHWFVGGRCAVHPVAPFGCAYFDCGMGPAEVQRRSKYLHILRICASSRYQSIIKAKLEKEMKVAAV